MTEVDVPIAKKGSSMRFHAFLMFCSILMLISSIMFTAVSITSLYLQGTHIVTLYLFAIATCLGIISILSIKYLKTHQ